MHVRPFDVFWNTGSGNGCLDDCGSRLARFFVPLRVSFLRFLKPRSQIKVCSYFLKDLEIDQRLGRRVRQGQAVETKAVYFSGHASAQSGDTPERVSRKQGPSLVAGDTQSMFDVRGCLVTRKTWQAGEDGDTLLQLAQIMLSKSRRELRLASQDNVQQFETG
jgi:hypothetical protein